MRKNKASDKKKSSHKPKPNRAQRHRGRPNHKGTPANSLRDVSVLIISGISEDGELIAAPAKWEEGRQPPHIVVTESGRHAALVKGDRILAKMHKKSPHLYQALVINVLPGEQEKPVLGVFTTTKEGGLIEPISRKMKESFIVAADDTLSAENGEFVSGVTLPGMPSMSMTYAKITQRLGRLDAPRAASLIASHMHNLPQVFSKEALAEAQAAEPPTLGEGRTNLRDIPLVTIDGEDARDFDDAVFAEPDGDGWHIVVAIADVAYYVAEGSALDAEALERGNSAYFPDRVIPMLPERLSNGLCSLMPNEDRYCLAVHIWIDAQGAMQRYEFVRGLMRSRARLTYEQVEASDRNEWVTNLYAAYSALAFERDHRGALDLNLPEYKIRFDEVGNVAAIAPKERLESHRLIEAYMIAANVAAADFLLKKKIPGIYRVHEPPDEGKLEELKILLKVSGYSLHTGAGIKAAHFNRILKQADGKPEQYLVNTAILRSQMQAYYSEENLGHFGLSLQKYCHFTSPIRRYADLVVHRSLASAIVSHQSPVARGNKSGNQRPTTNTLPETALHISDTERRAMMAERDASDRYKVSYMSRHVGQSFSGVIVSLNEYGLYVALNDTGVNGFIPVRNLQGDFFRYDKRHASFVGQRTHETFQIGQPLIIRVQTANVTTGSLIFELAKEVTTPTWPPQSKYGNKKHKYKKH